MAEITETTQAVDAEVDNDITKKGGGILTFMVEDQIYGIEIKYVTDIIEVQPITYIPKVPEYIKGVINLRGKVIPVMNIRSRFGKEEIPYDSRTCIIVMEYDDVSAGVIIDRVSEVIRVSSKDITAPPSYKSVNSNRFISHIVNAENHVKLILDCKKLIFE